MDSHIITPASIEQTLTDAKFICNAGGEDADRFLLIRCVIGPARCTPWFTAEQLEANGIVGIYDREVPRT